MSGSKAGPQRPNPRLVVDLAKIKHNARVITGMCREAGIGVTGVTKSCCGMPEVARALLAGGVERLADSRPENIRRMREAGVEADFVLLRLPMISQAGEAVALAGLSLHSEPAALRALSAEAVRQDKIHRVMLMVDLGDLREGVLPGDLVSLAEEAACLPGIELAGIGTNFACFGGVIPTREHLESLVRLAREVESSTGERLALISGGNSSSLDLVQRGEIPPGINDLRLGEGILLGRETTRRRPVAGTFQDAFRLVAEVVELKRKPSVPAGEIGQDAFGRYPAFRNRGWRWRAILAVGRQDVDPEGLSPLDEGVEILGASGDHLLADVDNFPGNLSVGSELAFNPNYSALLQAMTSPYVAKVVEQGKGRGGD